MRKLCAKWGPCVLTIEQKQCREDISIECLTKFYNTKAEFLRRFLTMDRAWVHHFIPETKKNLNNGLKRENRLLRRRKPFHLQATSWRRFFGMRLRQFLLKGYLSTASIMRTYCNLLAKISSKNGCIWLRRRWYFIRANAPAHKLKFKLLHYAPYSPDLTRSHYFLFPHLKKMAQWSKIQLLF